MQFWLGKTGISCKIWKIQDGITYLPVYLTPFL